MDFQVEVVRAVFAISKTNRYEWEIDFPDSSEPDGERQAVSHGKCEVIQDLHPSQRDWQVATQAADSIRACESPARPRAPIPRYFCRRVAAGVP